jgi:hypothetical protein
MRFVAIVLATACGSGGGSVGDPTPSAQAEAACERLPFAESTPVPEASGAAWLTVAGALRLVVVGDSGNRGAYGILDPDSGQTLEQGTLPLGDAPSDDLEGLATRGDKLYGLLAPGWMLVWERRGSGFALVEGAYPLGPVDLPDSGHGDTPPKSDGMVCPGKKNNCGRNYEGLCLAEAPASPCAGFAAAKADGKLYCLVEKDGRLALDKRTAIPIARPGVVADCTFADDGTLYVGTNMFDANSVYRVTGWQSPATAKVEPLGALGIGNSEVIAVRGEVIYRMSDLNVAPSLMVKFRCPRRGR